MTLTRTVLVCASTFLIACDSGTDVEPLANSYVLTHVDSILVPAELSRTFTVCCITTARVMEGSLSFISRDSARLALLAESRTVDTNGQEVASEVYCTFPTVAYRQEGNRVHLDLEVSGGPPSQGYPSGSISIHDTLVVSGFRLSGRHTLSPGPQVLANRRVELRFMAAPLVPGQCP